MKTAKKFAIIAAALSLVLSACNVLERLIGDRSDSDAPPANEQTTADNKKIPTPAMPASAESKPASVTASTVASRDTAENEPMASALSVEGVPDLDPTIGPKLSDVEREESQQFSDQAVKLYRKNDFIAAEAQFLKALQKNPSNLVFRYNLACISALTQKGDRAIALLRQFKETPDCPRCFIMLAKALEDADFDSIKDDARFQAVTDGAKEKLAAELKLAKWIEFDGRANGFPIRTNGLPAISDDGLRIAVVNRFKTGYRMQIILVSTGEVQTSSLLLNPKELEQLKNQEVTSKDLRGRLKERIDSAHKQLLGRTWVPFTIKSDSIAPTWLRGSKQQRFQLGNSTVTYRYPNLTVTNNKGRQTFSGKVGTAPDDNCTDLSVITEAYVNGQFHVMLFYQHNVTTKSCTPQPGKYHVVSVTGE